MKIAIHGAGGRMGQNIIRLAVAEGVQIVGAIESPASKVLGRDAGELAGVDHLGVAIDADVGAGLLGADVVIDFSRADAVPRLIQAAVRARVAIMSGTTGLDRTADTLFDEAAQVVPVLWAPNTSLGVAVLADIAADAARKLGPAFDVEIVETHHRAKVDAPSGTAVRLASAIRDARGNLSAVSGREGNVGPRRDDEIGIFAVRGGDVIGDHTVYLLGPGERIELTHKATSRDLFARGALALARFLCGKAPRRYTMKDMLDCRS